MKNANYLAIMCHFVHIYCIKAVYVILAIWGIFFFTFCMFVPYHTKSCQYIPYHTKTYHKAQVCRNPVAKLLSIYKYQKDRTSSSFKGPK